MNGIRIVATGHAVPAKIMDNDELSTFVDTNDEWIRTRTGVRQRHVCQEESCMSLAIEAAKNAVKRAQELGDFDVNEIGTILVATTTPDYAFPTVSCMIQNALGLEDETMSFDVSAACAGFLYGLNICRGILLNSKKKYALVVGAEELSRIADYTDRASCILFGDGSGAAIIELADNLYVQRCWSRGDFEPLNCVGVGKEGAKIFMAGNKVFRFAVTVLSEGVKTVLSDAGMTMDDVDYVIVHQANLRIIEHVQKQYPEHAHKFYVNIDRFGNTSAASIPIAMDELMREGKLESGMKVLSIGFGAGFVWSSLLFEV